MKNDTLTEFESEIIRKIYEHEKPKTRVPKLFVVLRERSGNGMYIRLKTNESGSDISGDETLGKNLHITVPDLSHGGGALLYFKHGTPTLLEIYVNGYDDWPEVIGDYRIEYR